MKGYFKSAISRAERLTKTDVRYVARGSFWLGLTQASSAVTGIVATVAFANLVSPETYGIYRYVLSTYAILSIFGLPGLDTALTQSVSNGHDGALAQAVKLRRRWTLLGSLASLLVAAYYGLQHDSTLAAVFAAVALFMPFLEAGALYSAFLNGKKMFKQWSLLEIATQVVATGAIVTTLFLTQNVFVIALVYLVAYSVTRTLATQLFAARLAANASQDPEMLSYSKSVSLFQIVTRITTSLDQVVLFHVLGPIQVAAFALASAVPNRIQSLLRIGGILAFPKLTQRSMEDIRRNLPRKLLLFTLGIAAIVALYILVAPTGFKWFFPKYLPALGYSKVLVLYTFSALTYPISAAFFAHKQIKPGYAISIVNLAVKIASLAIFVPLVGVWGAVISTLAASASTIVVAFYYLARRPQPEPVS